VPRRHSCSGVGDSSAGSTCITCFTDFKHVDRPPQSLSTTMPIWCRCEGFVVAVCCITFEGGTYDT
jgi:hypothetical protein